MTTNCLLLTAFFFFCTAVTIESEDDIREFVKAKIESLVANVVADQDVVVAETETNRFKSATTRFHRIFNIPVEEKLVNCKFFNLMLMLNGSLHSMICWSNLAQI